VTVAALQQMKRDAIKIVGIVAWDVQMARVADRVGVDLVSVGDSVGVNLWGRNDPLAVSVDEMAIVCAAVRRGITRALVSCDFPFGPLQAGTEAAVRTARRFVDDGGADMVKLDAAALHLEAVRAVIAAGVPVFAQMGLTPQTAAHYGIDPSAIADVSTFDAGRVAQFVDEARQLEDAGAALIDFTHSGPVAGPAVAAAVSIPVIGGLGGGPWLDGRMRMAHAAIGYAAQNLDNPADSYANVARVSFDALTAYASDVRAGRQIKGAARR
jgi:3-methyl-2-oxobutanoate hydroxymethyltransferase